MREAGAIFFDFALPNATTWAVLSALMCVALFFKFNRILSVRNWDLVSLFLLVPGLLLLQEGRALWFGYLWLMGGGAYFFIRCLLDLALVRRPTLTPNLNFAGMAWLTGTVFVSLGGVAVSRSAQQDLPIGKRSAVVEEAQTLATAFVEQTAGSPPGVHGTHFWVERGLAGACHLAVILALIVIGWRHFQDATTGMAAATLYLLIPYTSFYITQIHHVLPTALLLWAIAAYNWPTVAGLLVGLAAGSFFPVLTLPVWLSFYWGRGARRFICGFALTAVLSLAITGVILWLDGQLAARLEQTFRLSDWQPWLVPTGESFWKGVHWGVHWAYRIPVFVGYAAFVSITAIWPRPKDLSHLIALTAAILIGIQFWYADQGGVYILWYLPLLLLLVFRPNLSDRLPPPIEGNDLLARASRRVMSLAGRLVWRPRPLVRLG